MASFCASTTTTTTTPTPITSTTLASALPNPLLSKPSQLSAFRSNQTRRAAITCNAANNDDHQASRSTNSDTKFDRRNMLIGLGGLYGAATTLSGGPAVLAKPTAPDVTDCGLSSIDDGRTLDCCPPKPSEFVDFKKPKPGAIRIRPAAHMVDPAYIEKYSKALALMKALPDSDPRSFSQQAKVHCAYCNGGYHQAGLPNLDLQVHGSWLFFPFHRAYLYFYEKILGKLIDDPTFAIPYWNWDHPDGMSMPTMFNIPNSPFLNPNRDPTHLPPTMTDLGYDSKANEENVPSDELIARNNALMYKQMVSNAKTPDMFFGEPYRAGDPPSPGPGSIEQLPHGTLHDWVGNPANPLREDMGNFYSAGRDPIFYAHHANVDRTWSIWRTLGNNKDFTDRDYLRSYFYFFDENAKPVKISVRDCLDTKKLGYDYQAMDLPWLTARPQPKTSRARGVLKKVFSDVKNAVAAETKPTAPAPTITFPKTLGDKIIRTNVPRPQKSRSRKDKNDEEEVLIIELEVSRDVYSKFDVYINDEDERPTKENRVKTEYAGSFVNVPHKHKHGNVDHVMKTTIKFGLTELIEDIGADDDEGIDVTFVPRTGTEKVIIKNARIEFLS